MRQVLIMGRKKAPDFERCKACKRGILHFTHRAHGRLWYECDDCGAVCHASKSHGGAWTVKYLS